MAESQTNFEIKVDKLVYGGDGLARLDGRVVFVPFVLPGERVAVETVEKPGLVRAKLLGIREPSEAMANPSRAMVTACRAASSGSCNPSA